MILLFTIIVLLIALLSIFVLSRGDLSFGSKTWEDQCSGKNDCMVDVTIELTLENVTPATLVDNINQQMLDDIYVSYMDGKNPLELEYPKGPNMVNRNTEVLRLEPQIGWRTWAMEYAATFPANGQEIDISGNIVTDSVDYEPSNPMVVMILGKTLTKFIAKFPSKIQNGQLLTGKLRVGDGGRTVEQSKTVLLDGTNSSEIWSLTPSVTPSEGFTGRVGPKPGSKGRHLTGRVGPKPGSKGRHLTGRAGPTAGGYGTAGKNSIGFSNY